MWKKLVKSGMVLAFGGFFSAAALAAEKKPVPTLTLTQAVSMAVHTHPEYGVAASEKNAAIEQLTEARAQYFPSVDFQAQGGRERTSSPFLAQTENLWQRRGSLTLTQLLFDGWGTQNNVRSRKYRAESSARHVREVTEFLGLETVQAYLDVLRQRSLLKIARSNLDDHSKILDKVKAGEEGGTITSGDLAQVEARVNDARANISSVEQNLRSAEALFIEKVGEMPEELTFPPVPHDRLPATAEEAISAALVGNPTLAVHESSIRSAEAEYDGTASAYSPRVDLQVNGSEGRNEEGVRGHRNNFSVLAIMRWNLSRGGGDAARRREFMYRYAVARERSELALRQVEKDVRDTWAAHEAAKKRTGEFLKQSKHNEKVVKVYMDQFNLSRRTLLDVLDGQNELFSSRSNHINAMYTEAFSVFRLLALEGKMLKTLGVEKPRNEGLEVY